MLINNNQTQQPEPASNNTPTHIEETPDIWVDPRAKIDRRKVINLHKIPNNGCRRMYDRRTLQYRHTEQWWLQRDYDNCPLDITIKHIEFDDDIFAWLDTQNMHRA